MVVEGEEGGGDGRYVYVVAGMVFISLDLLLLTIILLLRTHMSAIRRWI